ncbi:MAG: tyrosine-type recombinase/integrase [Chloroflexota bacterium]
MRIGEAVALTTDTMQLEQRRVIIGAKGKGRRERAVPVGDAALPGGGRTL